MKVRVFVPVVLFFCLFSQSVRGESDLGNLVNYALEHSRNIKKSAMQIQEAGFKQREIMAQGLPQIEGSASYSKMFLNVDIPESLYAMIPETYKPVLDQIGNIDKMFIGSVGVQVTQLIYSQSYIVGLQTAKKSKELYSILKLKNEEDLIEEVAGGYYMTVSLMLQLETVKNSLRNLGKIHEIAELTYKNDLIKETDVNRLKVTITNLEVTKETIENAINTQINYLKALSGMPEDSTIEINSRPFIEGFDSTPVSVDFRIDNIPSYMALMKQADIYKQQTRLSKATYYPTLAAFGQFKYSSYNTEYNLNKWNSMPTIGLSLSIPIFKSGATNAKIKQALLKEQQLNEDISQTRDFLAVGFQNSSSEYKNAMNLLKVQQENKELAKKVYNQTILQYREGMASLADVLNINSEYLQANNSYNQQIIKCKTSEIKILKSTGNLKQLANTK